MSLPPEYRDLPIDSSRPPRSAWGVWGDEDQLGTLNLLTPAETLKGIACVQLGQVIPLNLPLELPSPALYGREGLKHTIFPNEVGYDDRVDNLFPQSGSQWDSLSHVENPDHGFYNGRGHDDFTGRPGTKNGIENAARKGIAGRGVLLDMARHFSALGDPIDGSQFREFTVSDLEHARKAQGVDFEAGDILLIRSGWLEWYLQADEETRDGLARDSMTRLQTPGLAGGEDMAAYLWDNRFSAVASDAPAVEAWPHALEVDSYLHFRLIPLLGMALGELWDLEALASACAADGRYECLLTSAPLNLLGGVGSTANALAIR